MSREEALQASKEKMDYYESDKRLRGAIETLVPELRESEDERIRKLLIWQVHRNIEDETNELAGSVYDGIKGHDPELEESIEDWKKCLAWLEKQKEPHYTKRNALFDKCVENCDPEVMKRVSDEVDEMLEKEQKPWKVGENAYFTPDQMPRKFKLYDKVHWHDDDTNVITITGFRDDAYLTDSAYGPILYCDENNWEKVEQKPADLPAGFYVTLPDGKKYYAKEMRCNGMNVKVIEPKPAEWSEEDERMFSRCIKSIETSKQFADSGTLKAAKDKEIAWLKSLCSQPQGIYQQVVKGLRDMCDRYEQNGMFTDGRARDFLANVRVKCNDAIDCTPILDEPSWKPSDEQMADVEICSHSIKSKSYLEEKLSKNLKEIAGEWAENETYGKSDIEFEMAYKGFKAGAEWMEKQCWKR